jgi:DNA-nicking Smr family endonuclease
MSARRHGPKGLSPDDITLWERAMKDATPLRKRAPRPASGLASEESSERAATRLRREMPPPKGPLGIDGALEKRLRRGMVEVDATLDLHGETQTRAYDRLLRFLAVAEVTGRRCILVITGRGAPKTEADLDADWRTAQERGVLRRMVPQWLKEPPLHDKVLAVRPAHRHHGGSGAFYVILRRTREGTGRQP